MTNTSQSVAYLRDKSSSSLASPTFMRQFSSRLIEPGAASTPSTQSRISGTSRPSNSARRLATGAKVSASLHTPSLGRPRCEVTSTVAPFSRASFSVGNDAVMRCSEVILPASIGTLRSWRIRTRLLLRSRSLMRMMGIGLSWSIKGKSTRHYSDSAPTLQMNREYQRTRVYAGEAPSILIVQRHIPFIGFALFSLLDLAFGFGMAVTHRWQ